MAVLGSPLPKAGRICGGGAPGRLKAVREAKDFKLLQTEVPGSLCPFRLPLPELPLPAPPKSATAIPPPFPRAPLPLPDSPFPWPSSQSLTPGSWSCSHPEPSPSLQCGTQSPGPILVPQRESPPGSLLWPHLPLRSPQFLEYLVMFYFSFSGQGEAKALCP